MRRCRGCPGRSGPRSAASSPEGPRRPDGWPAALAGRVTSRTHCDDGPAVGRDGPDPTRAGFFPSLEIATDIERGPIGDPDPRLRIVRGPQRRPRAGRQEDLAADDPTRLSRRHGSEPSLGEDGVLGSERPRSIRRPMPDRRSETRIRRVSDRHEFAVSRCDAVKSELWPARSAHRRLRQRAPSSTARHRIVVSSRSEMRR